MTGRNDVNTRKRKLLQAVVLALRERRDSPGTSDSMFRRWVRAYLRGVTHDGITETGITDAEIDELCRTPLAEAYSD